MARILVTEQIAEAGLAAMKQAGHEVDVRLGLSPEELLGALQGAHALIVRSATKVTAAVLEAAGDLIVVGRAGTGVDNVDVDVATRRGVIVANAPRANSVSMAEHTMALLLAQSRNIPQAHSALRAGRWERSRWRGVELLGKTLGVLGLGGTGALVVQRAAAFGMRVVAWDPWMSKDRARQLGVEPMELEEVFGEADFVTIHLLLSPESRGLIGRELLAKAKPGLRLVNAARGGIVDEDALVQALASGQLGGAALDVFAAEPTTSSPLFELDNVVVTPHLGASTVEAQDKAGVTIAEQVVLALAGELVPLAVNLPAAEVPDAVRPFIDLSEQMGRFLASLAEGLPRVLEVQFQGGLAGLDTRVLSLAVLKGLLATATEGPVSYVNAPQLAAERGLEVRETATSAPGDYVNLVTARAGRHSVAGTISGRAGEARFVMVDDHTVELPPAAHMLVVRNDDRPGMIGAVGSALGAAGVSISSMAVGPSAGAAGTALMVLSTDRAVPTEVVARLAAEPGILDVHRAALGS